MLLKTSLICFLLIIYMTGLYYRKPHIPVKSTRIFQWLTGVALVNALFDLITIYTVNHRDRVHEGTNLVAHIIYLMSILGFIYLLFLYMRSYLESQIRFPNGLRVCHSLPVILSAIGILTLPITYEHGRITDYSLGPKAYALYLSIIIYLILILYYCLRYWEILDGEKRLAILLAVPIYILTSVVQMVFPETLIAILCSTLIMMGLILSNENTEKYVDEKTTLFNQYSFEAVLEEYDFEKQKNMIAVLCFCKMENNLDWKQDVLILKDIHKGIRTYHLQGYRISENGVAFIGSSEEKTKMILEEVKDRVEEKYGRDNITIETKMISGKDAATKYSCMQNAIAFCTEAGSHFAYIDYLTHIYNRNAFERDLDKIKESGGYGYYIIADLNDLKTVNDTMGHSAGDELLQGFAGMLAGVVSNKGKAYRQGGDEFAVLYNGDVHELIDRLGLQCEKQNRSRNIPISYAIGYCELKNKNFLDTADSMMYEDKKRIKSIRQDRKKRKRS